MAWSLQRAPSELLPVRCLGGLQDKELMFGGWLLTAGHDFSSSSLFAAQMATFMSGKQS